ncbi:MAG TPA: hypothetical protein VGT43_02650 [Burkholderiales bacterium]|nr:hypothetical protein [Burkholderiales bacterium]
MTATVAVFAIVYVGMILGWLPFLQLDRTAVRADRRVHGPPDLGQRPVHGHGIPFRPRARP